jgi:ankyrin repeat protein
MLDVVNTCRNNGAAPLVIACEYHHTEIVEMLLEYKADINKCKDSGESALYIACQNGHLDIVLKLSPLPTHLFTFVLIFLSNSISTMSKYPFWQAIYKGDAPLSTHLFTFVLRMLIQM